MAWWNRKDRATEGLADSVAASGASGYAHYEDPDLNGFRQVGAQGRREVPRQTVEKARTLSVHAYRTNPMARAIIDTYTSFCVGDSGLKLSVDHADVEAVARRFWDDPKNDLEGNQEILLRSHMLLGETGLELMVGQLTGTVRFAYVNPEAIVGVSVESGNPMWLDSIAVAQTDGNRINLDVMQMDDLTELRTGQVAFWRDWRTVVSDRRGYPFLAPVLDWLTAYDEVLYNLIDRTALARYLVWDVVVKGDQGDVDDFIAQRGGQHAPRSGSIEVHNEEVEWKAVTAQSGAVEDRQTAATAMTNLAAGSGLAKTWLAEPEDANRATSLTMAEPVRRRVGGVQKAWLGHMTELVRFQVDRAVAAGALPATVGAVNDQGDEVQVPASSTVRVVGPEIAASDAKVNAEILVSLSQSLTTMKAAGMLSDAAIHVAAKKAWEEFVGMPYTHQLEGDDVDAEAIAAIFDEAAAGDDDEVPVG